MLHKSFKPAKCKTALKLAVSRIKLLKNKKEAQVKQLRGEVAKLLEAGQDQTARIRVEHVVREEKAKTAYELIEIFCELIVARLPIIESQKNCPVDLKEAVSSVIFATPRCADIPELMDVRKNFAAKYGKEFVSAAVELRPDCGVNRMLIDKLSAKAPDGPTKIKILTAIAEEYNIKWEPKAFGESDPKIPSDLLNGPSTFERSTIQMEPILADTPVYHDKNLSHNTVQHQPKPDEKHGTPFNFQEHNARSEIHSQKSASSDIGSSHSTSSGPYKPEVRPSGNESEKSEFSNSYSGDGNTYSVDRKNWNMDFKDAASAARAAAESAEQASLAARAAAELSTREKLNSSDSQKHSVHVSRDEGHGEYSGSRLQSEHLPKELISNDSHGSSFMGGHEKNYSDDHKNMERSRQPSSLKSTTSHIDENPPENIFNVTDEYSQNLSRSPKWSYKDDHESTGKSSQTPSSYTTRHIDENSLENNLNVTDEYSQNISGSPKRSYEDDHESTVKSRQTSTSYSTATHIDVNPLENSFYMEDKYPQNSLFEHETNDFFSTTILKEQSSKSDIKYVHEQLDDTESKDTRYYGEIRMGKESSMASSHSHSTAFSEDPDPFVTDQIKHDRNTNETSSYLDSGVVFDDYVSEDDSDLLGSKSPLELLAAGANTSMPRKNTEEIKEMTISQSFFSEHLSPPLFSESLRSSAVGSQSNDISHVSFDHSDGASSESEGDLENSRLVKESTYSRNVELVHSRSDELARSSSSLEKKKFPRDEPSHKKYTQQPSSLSPVDDTLQDSEILRGTSSESGSELNFPKLRGGFKNQKGSSQFPRKERIQSESTSSSTQENENAALKIEQSRPTLSSPVRAFHSSKSPTEELFSRKVSSKRGEKATTNLDDSEEEVSDHTYQTSRESFSKKVGTEAVNKRSSPLVPIKHLDLITSDSEEDVPIQPVRNNPRQVAGISRRTKMSSLNSGSSDREARSYYESASPLKTQSKVNRSDCSETSEQPQLIDRGVSNLIPESKKFFHEERFQMSLKEESSKPIPDDAVEGKPSRNRSGHSEASGREERVNSSGREEQTPKNYQPVSKPSPVVSKWSLPEETLRIYGKEEAAAQSPPKVVKKAIRSPPKVVIKEDRAESLKKSTGGESPSSARASHVHPKLPDYDNFTAHFQSIRQNR